MEKDSRVHGSIFFLLKKFVINHYSEAMWEQLLSEAGIEPDRFQLTENYPIEDIHAIMERAVIHSGLSAVELLEKFGKESVPELFTVYKDYLNPKWKTFDVLINTEHVMHGAVRNLNSTANPPVLNVTKLNDQTLMIDYFSKRRMGALAIGLIKGIAIYYNEQDKIEVISITDPMDERVQIKVVYNK